MSTLRELGKSTAEILKRLHQPIVGREALCDALGYIENAGAPSSVTPSFIGQWLFDTSGSQWYRAHGVSSGNWTPVGDNTLTAAELGFLDGATAGTGVASKAVVLGSSGEVAIPGEMSLDGNTLAVEAGVGITGGTGTVYESSVVKVGGIITTRILIDLTGLNGGGTAGDIIGTNGAGVAHLGQITAARNGTILGGKITCLETPAGSNVDVDLWSANEATGVEDTAISALTGESQLINHGNWAAGEMDELEAMPVADQYLYLTSGAATDAAFTAGKFLIEMYGYDA